MNRIAPAVCLCAAINCASYSPAEIAPKIDQQYEDLNTGSYGNVGLSNTIDWAQTFTVGRTGQLTGFDLHVWRETGVTNPLLYDIRRVINGTPTEPDSGPDILANGSVAAAEVKIWFTFDPGYGLLHVDLTSRPVNVTTGDALAIVLRSDDPGSRGYGYQWMLVQNGAYPGGKARFRTQGAQQWSTDPNYPYQNQDCLFATYVSAVPEPAACGLLLLALPAATMIMFRRRT
jgi:hypothetical protein